ncbi:MAG: putative rane protein [Chlamydiia bacterium]|nr:putative rane protein [Chlamydiia bacterium]
MNDVIYTASGWGFLSVLSFVILLLYWLLWDFSKRKAARLASSENLKIILRGRSSQLFWLKALSLAFSFALAIMALMQPEWHEVVVGKAALYDSVDEVVFLLDDSASMSARDTSEKNSRFLRAQEIINGVCERLGGVSVSLYAFAGNTENVIPSTMDLLSFRILMQALQVDETETAGTDFSQLFKTMKAAYLDRAEHKRIKFVLLTDGEDTSLLSLSHELQKAKEKVIYDEVALFKKKGMGWYIVGMGTSQGGQIPGLKVVTKMQPDFLEAIAKSCHGKCYFDTDKNSNLSTLADDLVMELVYQKGGARDSSEKVSLFYYPLLGAILFLLTALFLPERDPYV